MKTPAPGEQTVKRHIRSGDRRDVRRGDKLPLSEKSKDLYTKLLVGIYHKSGTSNVRDFLNDEDAFLQTLDAHYENKNTQKTILAAAYKATGKVGYHTKMMELSEEVDRVNERQHPLAHREDAIDTEGVKAKHQELLETFDERNRLHVPQDETDVINTFISGVYGAYAELPPRRLEYATVKWRNIDPETDNFIRGRTIVINKHKNSNRRGPAGESATIVLPQPLIRVATWLVEHSPCDYLLWNSKDEKFSPQAFNKRMQSIFGKYFGADQARSTFLTDVFSGAPRLLTQKRLAKEMGHSTSAQQRFYVKKT